MNLSPFLEREFLRVGGRLTKSALSYSSKLSADHVLTRLIIRYTHRKNLHSGTQATLAFVRQKFWPIAARNMIRKIVRECIICIKHSPTASQCKMGNLLIHRVQQSRPFAVCGIDYGGPLYIRDGKRRNAKIIKAYMAVFICFATKAIHVSDLSIEAFLNAFKRFPRLAEEKFHIFTLTTPLISQEPLRNWKSYKSYLRTTSTRVW